MSSLLLNLLFPPKCAGCDALIPVSDWRRGDTCLCRDCRAAWEVAKLEKCKQCGEEMPDCRCMPAYLAEAGMQALCKLCRYSPESEEQRCVADRLLYRVKDGHVVEYERFLASQLAPVVRAELDRRGWMMTYEDGSMPFETVITYCPRSPAKARQMGTDQAERVAKLLAKRLGLPFQKLLVHRESREQKRVKGEERKANAAAAYRRRHRASATLKRVILVDDIVTTGASMAACTEILLADGAISVLGVSVAVTERKKHKKIKNT